MNILEIFSANWTVKPIDIKSEITSKSLDVTNRSLIILLA